MTYQAYVNRIKRIAVIYDVIRKFKVLIISVLSVLVLLTSTFLFVNGMIVGGVTCDATVVYGQTVTPTTKVLFGRASYEYTPAGEEAWSSQQPTMPGEYLMRAVTIRSFGIVSYSSPVAFTVEKFKTELSASETVLPYGDTPTALITLAAGDQLDTVSFEFDNYAINPTDVRPIEGSLRILNAKGDDVTEAYDITLIKKNINIVPRPITVKVENAEKVYDGTPLTSDGWQLAAGSLLAGDELIVSFEGAVTDVGTASNTATATVKNTVIHEDVSIYYDISYDIGELTVLPRPITIKTESGTHVYDANPFTLASYTVISELSLPVGHTLTVKSSTEVVDATDGVANEFTDVRITLADGRDVTENFTLSYECGLLSVTPRPLALLTGSLEKVYDATPLSQPTVTLVDESQLLEGHSVKVLASVSVINAGVHQNAVTSLEILSSDGKDVSQNYAVSYEYGTLTVRQRPVTLTGDSGVWMYDGTVHRSEGNLTSENLLEGHTVQGQFTASIRFVPSTPLENTFTARIFADGTDVTENYEITCVFGTLNVTPRPVTLRSDAQKIYDATPLTTHICQVTADSPYGLVEGDQLSADVSGEGTDVKIGGYPAVIRSVTVMNRETDVTACYDFTFEVGILTVTPRPVTLRSDGTNVYDGTVFRSTVCTDLGDTEYLVEGHTALLTTNGSIIDVGTADNLILSYVILDETSRDVTHNYSVTCVTGTLTVTPRSIKIKTGDSTRVFDATTLNCTDYTVISELDFVNGEHILVYSSTEIIHVSKEENRFVSYDVVDASGNPRTRNYTVEMVYGSLELTPRPVLIQTQSDSKMYDAEALENKNGIFLSNQEALDRGYMPPVDGHELVVFSATQITTVSQSGSKNEFTQYDIVDAAQQSWRSDYDVRFDCGILEITPRPLTVYSHSASRVYDDKYLTEPNHDIGGAGLVGGHNTVVSEKDTTAIRYVSESGTPNIFKNVDVIDPTTGTSVKDNYILTYVWGTLTVKAREVTLRFVDAEMIYNGEYQYSHAYTEAFNTRKKMVSGHQVIIHHSTEALDAGFYVNELDETAGYHTVMTSDNRDVTENYEITWQAGELTILPRPVAVIPDGAEKIYDDIPMTCIGYSVLVNEAYPYDFVLDHYLDVESSLSVLNVKDSAKNDFFAYTVRSRETDASVDGNYIITVMRNMSGNLIIHKRRTVLETWDAEKIYDGTPLSQTEYTVLVNENAYPLVSWHKIDSFRYPSYTDVGVYENLFDLIRVISNDNRDVTENYDLVCNPGKLTIHKRAITVITATAEKYYDATPLSDASFEIIWTDVGDGGTPIAAGQSFIVLSSSSITDAGETDNEFTSYMIRDIKTRKNVTSNYEITLENGKLRVLPREIIVVTGSANQVYDHTPLSTDEFEIKGMGMAPNQFFVPLTVTEILYANEVNAAGLPIPVPNAFLSYQILDQNGRELSLDNYNITFEEGELIIYRRDITLKITLEKYYDGKPIAISDLTCEDLGIPNFLVEGHSVDIAIENDRTDAGEEPIRFRHICILTPDGEDVTANYRINRQTEPLRIYKSSIEITSSAEKYYDGTPLVSRTPTVTGTFNTDHQIHLVTNGSQTEIGISANRIISVEIIDPMTGNDVSHNYDVTVKDGTLEVKKLAFTIISGSDKKAYDGTPLVNATYSMDIEALPQGYHLTVNITGSQTEIGISPNEFSYSITHDVSGDLTDHVDVTCVFGELEVTEPELVEIQGGKSTVLITMFSELGGTYYVRDAYYGDYYGRAFAQVAPYTAGPIHPMLLSGMALQNSGLTTHKVSFDEQTYYIVYQATTGLGPLSDLPTVMDGTCYSYDVITGSDPNATLPPELIEFELAYREYVYEQYLRIPESTKAAMLEIAMEAGIFADDINVIERVKQFIKTSAEYDLEYEFPGESTDMAVDFLTTYKRGVCVQFATAATMMFRALGIPARYVTGAVPTVKANTWDTYEVIRHAWTEVYIDGYGWVVVEATPAANLDGDGDGDGEDSDDKPEITIMPYDITVTYDGKPHSPSGDQFYLSGVKLPAGYRITDIVFSEAHINVGVYETKVISYRILDENGNDVTAAFNENYQVDTGTAKLTILARPLTIATSSATRYYNEKPLVANSANDWWISAGQSLPEGHTIEIRITGTITEEGSVDNDFVCQIKNENGIDVTDQFDLTKALGKLTVLWFDA